MNILTETNPEVIKDWCELCLNKNLYIVGRMAEIWFTKPEKMLKMALLDNQSTIVGWSMIYSDDHIMYRGMPVLGVYVQKPLRKKGWGTKLISEIVQDIDFPLFIDSRIKFFRRPDVVNIIRARTVT